MGNCMVFLVGRTARPCRNLSVYRRKTMDNISDRHLRTKVLVRESVFCSVERR